MAAAARALLLGAVVCAAVMAVAATTDGEAALIVGQAKCGDCTRKSMNAEDVFKGLQVAIKCKNADGKYETKAVGDLDGNGAFGVPLAAGELHGADCFAQLHSATTNAPCPGQEPSKIVLLSTTNNVNDDEGGKTADNTFVAVAGKVNYSSSPAAECASAFLCDPVVDYFRKHPFFEYFHKKPEPEPEPLPQPDPKPLPSPENGGGAGNCGGGAAPPPSSSVYH
uniref:Proline-rich protein n=1 Tax=Leersia perrieri TaxID=77586 RepID=A0A0D9XHT6_9ORYZ